jgi:serine/threonine protein kinase
MVAFVEPLADHDPRQVGGFRLQARLGAGGMGRVFLGYSPGGRPVAVKVVHPDLARDPEFMQRFRREVAAAQSVSDAYTAAVVGAGPDDSPPWLATTFVAGPSLADLVTRSGPLPEHAVWRLAGGLAEALQAIHSHGLIHRDLKPGNILIAADGPRVIDFGISRTTEGTVVTATHTAIGTPAYMSPEQAQGHPVGPASDVFSLGSVLAFAAAGAAPFGSSGTEMFAIAYRVVNGEPDLSGVPAGLRPLIDACLAKDPAARPGDSRLIADVASGATAFPDVTPGRFWPDQVATLLESGAYTPVLPPPAPLTPPPRSPATDVAAGGQYPPTEAAVRRPYSPVTEPGFIQVDTPAVAAAMSRLRRGPRWLLPAALSLAVAVGAAIAILLALSSSPKPPTFLGTNSPVAGPTVTPTSAATRTP